MDPKSSKTFSSIPPEWWVALGSINWWTPSGDVHPEVLASLLSTHHEANLAAAHAPQGQDQLTVSAALRLAAISSGDLLPDGISMIAAGRSLEAQPTREVPKRGGCRKEQ